MNASQFPVDCHNEIGRALDRGPSSPNISRTNGRIWFILKASWSLGTLAWSAFQFLPEGRETIPSGISGCRRLSAAIPTTECIKEELDSAGDSQLLEDPVDVVPDGMFLYF